MGLSRAPRGSRGRRSRRRGRRRPRRGGSGSSGRGPSRPGRRPSPSRPGRGRRSWEQGLHEFARRERGQVVLALADADEPDGQAELGGDGDGRAALGRPVDLGQEDPRQAGELQELARLGDGVLADRRVEDEQGFEAGLGELADDDPLDLLELVHEVGVGMDAARGVDEEDVALLGLERLGGVEDDGRRVGAVGALDDGNAELLCPRARAVPGPRPGRCRPRRARPAGPRA